MSYAKMHSSYAKMHNHEKVINYHEIVIEMPYFEHNSMRHCGLVVLTLDVDCQPTLSLRVKGFMIGSQKDS